MTRRAADSTRNSISDSTNLGTAAAAKMLMIRSTITNSMSVNPLRHICWLSRDGESAARTIDVGRRTRPGARRRRRDRWDHAAHRRPSRGRRRLLGRRHGRRAARAARGSGTSVRVTGVIQAGGKSTRMGGAPKALIELGGCRIVERVVAARAQPGRHLLHRVLGDGHGRRDTEGEAGDNLRGLQPGRSVNHAQVRRHGPWPRHLSAPRRGHGRRDRRHQRRHGPTGPRRDRRDPALRSRAARAPRPHRRRAR